MVLIAFYVDLYYNIIIAWGLHFFVHSFTTELPWAKCNNPWNTENCFEINDATGEGGGGGGGAKGNGSNKDANGTSFIRNSAALEYFK